MSVHVTLCSSVIGRYWSVQSRCPCVSGPHRMIFIRRATAVPNLRAGSLRIFNNWKQFLGWPEAFLAALDHEVTYEVDDIDSELWRCETMLFNQSLSKRLVRQNLRYAVCSSCPVSWQLNHEAPTLLSARLAIKLNLAPCCLSRTLWSKLLSQCVLPSVFAAANAVEPHELHSYKPRTSEFAC